MSQVEYLQEKIAQLESSFCQRSVLNPTTGKRQARLTVKQVNYIRSLAGQLGHEHGYLMERYSFQKITRTNGRDDYSVGTYPNGAGWIIFEAGQ